MARVKSNGVARCGCFLVIIGTIFLTLAIFMYLKVYKSFSHTKAGTCITVNAYYNDDITGKCSCGRRCWGYYTCLIIQVKLDPDGPPNKAYVELLNNKTNLVHSIESFRNKSISVDKVSRTKRIILFENEHNLWTNTCSYHVHNCSKDYDTNVKQVVKYEETYGPKGTRFHCNYLPDDPTKVVRVTSKMTKFIHFFTWSSVGIVLGIGCLVYSIWTHPNMSVLHLLGVPIICRCCNPQKKDKDASTKNRERGTADERQKMQPQYELT